MHERSYGYEQYIENEEHFDPKDRHTNGWDKARFISWATKQGQHTLEVIAGIFASSKREEQGYNESKNILKLAQKYDSQRLEIACEIGLIRYMTPRYKNIKSILETNQDIEYQKEKINAEYQNLQVKGKFVRGAQYYEKNK